jgi:hypothetical protein
MTSSESRFCMVISGWWIPASRRTEAGWRTTTGRKSRRARRGGGRIDAPRGVRRRDRVPWALMACLVGAMGVAYLASAMNVPENCLVGIMRN